MDSPPDHRGPEAVAGLRGRRQRRQKEGRVYCVECGIRLSIVDAEFAVETEDGLVHSRCFEDAAENERRRDMGDPPLPPKAAS